MAEAAADEEEVEEEVPVVLATAVLEGPLPYNFKVNPAGGFDKFGYSHTATAKEWRNPDVKLATQYERPEPDHLFSAVMDMVAKEPDALLNPPPLSKDEKKAAREAARLERERRAELEDEAREEEDETKEHEKWLAACQLDRRKLAVYIGRKAFNYGIGTDLQPSEEQLESINAEIKKVLPDDDIELTSDQALTWLAHAVPIDRAAKKYFNAGGRISAYQSIVNDIYQLLLVEELEGSRFTELEDTALSAAQLLAQAVRFGPFEETSEGSGDWVEMADLDTLEEYIFEKREEERTVKYAGVEVELSALGATLYRYGASMSFLKYARNSFNKLLENRVRTAADGARRAQGVKRRDELRAFFGAIGAAEIKKGIRAVNAVGVEVLEEGNKSEMVDALLSRWAPKRQRRQQA